MEKLYHKALCGTVYNVVAKPCENLDDVAVYLVNGFCVVLFPEVGAIAYEVKTGEKRSLTGPELEHTTKGPKDAFVETVRSNTSLIRRHLRTPDLRFYETTVGQRSLTNVTVVWIDGITNPDYVTRMKKRLQSIDVDGLINPSSVEEYVTGSRKTPFPLLQYTERTDRFCNGLLRGRVGLFVDGLPLGYLAPVNLGYLMDSPEDLARDYVSASWVRMLRYAALVIGLLLPAVYVAMMEFHLSWIPQPLLDVIQKGKESVPFSAIWEGVWYSSAAKYWAVSFHHRWYRGRYGRSRGRIDFSHCVDHGQHCRCVWLCAAQPGSGGSSACVQVFPCGFGGHCGLMVCAGGLGIFGAAFVSAKELGGSIYIGI